MFIPLRGKVLRFHFRNSTKGIGALLDRRQFLRTAALAAGGAAVLPIRALGSRYQTSSGYFGLHEFIEGNADAVFIMKTNVEKKTDSAAIKEAGLVFARSVIIPKEKGVPLTSLIPVKPNLTCSSTSDKRYTLEYGMGIVTDPFFTEGIIEGMKELGLSGKQFYIREVNCPEDFGPRGFIAMAERTGAEMRDMSAQVGVISASDLVWKETPNGVWFRKIPYLWPVNAPNTWLLNIAKFKAHGMGITLCAKNLQGTIAKNYQAHCTSYGSRMTMDSADQNPNANKDIQANYNRHVAAGIPRWDKPGSGSGGIWQETWASRCIDNNSVNPAGLHIIEGIYGRDGNGFLTGPNPPGNDNNQNGQAWDYMSNIIIFGKNPFAVDIIGHWLAGHEPGNFGLFYLAKERGLCRVINPMKIPVYEWKPGAGVKLTPLTDFTRTPLKTYYLQRNYLGQTETFFHLCNESCEYPKDEPMAVDRTDRPEVFVLSQNRPNPFNPRTSIEFSLPRAGYARMEIYNAAGQLVEVLVDERMAAGKHLAVWNTEGRASGAYYYRFRFGGFTETKKMMLVK
jgi:hypothetical protein